MKALFLGHFAATVAPQILAKVQTSLESSILDDDGDAAQLGPLLADTEIVVGHIWRAAFPPAPRLRLHPAGQASGQYLQAPGLAGAARARDLAGAAAELVHPHRSGVCPEAADIVALYLQPPENAVVLSVDEKPHIQALERAQGWLKLPNGKALTGFNHEYKRHGTTTLFAALDVVTGLVQAGHYQRRRRVEFLDFMNRVTLDHPGREIHVILDNLNTHKPKHDC